MNFDEGGVSWLVESGEMPWDELVETVARRLDDILVGAILEIISAVPGIGSEAERWCRDRNHSADWETDGSNVRLRIRKGIQGEIP